MQVTNPEHKSLRVMQDIKFDPQQGKIFCRIEMKGLVVITYTLRLWSSDPASSKVVQVEIGNNKQPHDDRFWLHDVSHPQEPSVANNNRFAELVCRVHTDEDHVPFRIEMVFHQANVLTGKEVTLGKDIFEGTISHHDGGRSPVLGGLLKI